MELPATVPKYDEADRCRVGQMQSEAVGKLEEYEMLYSLSIGNVSANYDVEGFRGFRRQLPSQDFSAICFLEIWWEDS